MEELTFAKRNNKIREMKKNGATISQIAKEFGISQTSVYRIVGSQYQNDSCNLVCNTAARISDDDVLDIADLIMKGFTNTEISNELGVSTSTVSDIRCKKSHLDITRGMDFPKSKHPCGKGVFQTKSLTKIEVLEICKWIMAGYRDCEISRILKYNANTIGKIRRHESFVDLTHDMEFPKPHSRSMDNALSEKE